MRYEVSERLISSAQKDAVLSALEIQFKKVAASVKRNGDEILVQSIEASFGSINRKDTTTVSVKNADGGYLLIADVHYRPSIAFWIIFVISIFTYVLWLIPVIFYLMQKQTVRKGIEETFQRVKNEHMTTNPSSNRGAGTVDELEKFANLLDRGLISKEEFDAKKKQILGS
jgi:hypothetical protein